MDNLLIVESENDKYFIDAVINHLNLKQITVEDWTICIDEYECIGGVGNLESTLNALKIKIIKEEIEKIGIIFDQDTHTVNARLEQINLVIKKVFEQNAEKLKDTHQFIDLNADENTQFQLACYLINLNGQGEVENLLKEIKNTASPHADCLEKWNYCLQTQDNPINFKPKDLLKEWIRFYIRYDTCKGKERNQAERKCNLKAALLKPVWDFDHECLNELKEFLKLFKNEVVAE
jgi:hypothetical protein